MSLCGDTEDVNKSLILDLCIETYMLNLFAHTGSCYTATSKYLDSISRRELRCPGSVHFQQANRSM